MSNCCIVCNKEILIDTECQIKIGEDGIVKVCCLSCKPNLIKCYKVSNIEYGSWVMHDKPEDAVEDIMVTLEEMPDKERKEIDEFCLDSVAKELTETALKSLQIGDKTHLFNDFFTVEAVAMTEEEFKALPEFDGC